MLQVVSGLIFCLPFSLSSQLWAQAAAEAKAGPRNVGQAASPESASSTPISTFTSRSQLVLVPVVVTGKNGVHVGGLGRDAFQIEEQGKTRSATIFEEVKPVAAGAFQPPRTAPKLEGRSNFNYENAPTGHMTIVVLDMLNTPYLQQGDGTRHLMEYLTKWLPRGEATVLFGLGAHGLRMLYPPTTDTAALLEALQRVERPVVVAKSKGQPAMPGTTDSQSEDSATQIAQQISSFISAQYGTIRDYDFQWANWTTLTAMTQIAQAYGMVPGRKALIWASAGFPFMASAPGISRETLLNKYDETWRELNSASIAVYSVDVSGLAGFNGALIGYRTIARKQQTLREFSAETGGIACLDTTDIERCIGRVIEDSRSYYLLGYYLPTDDQKPGWRKLKVKVAGGAHVRAREGFYVAAEQTPESQHRQMVEAVLSPIELTGVRFNVRELPVSAGRQPGAVGKSKHEFEIGVLGRSVTVDTQNSNAVDLSVVAVSFTAGDKAAAQTEHHMSAKLQPEMMQKFRDTGVSVQQALDLAPGKYEIKFAVRDNLNGEIGSVGYPLEVK